MESALVNMVCTVQILYLLVVESCVKVLSCTLLLVLFPPHFFNTGPTGLFDTTQKSINAGQQLHVEQNRIAELLAVFESY